MPFATAAEMGAKVVRAQTMGDTLGCPLCIEPEQGKFNDAALRILLTTHWPTAHKYGMRLIIPPRRRLCHPALVGGLGQYIAWNRKTELFRISSPIPPSSPPTRPHIDAVLNHVTRADQHSLQGRPPPSCWPGRTANIVRTRRVNEPAAVRLRWPARGLLVPRPLARTSSRWTSITFTSTPPASSASYPKVLDNPSTDLVTFEFYPHWDALLGPGGPPTDRGPPFTPRCRYPATARSSS